MLLLFEIALPILIASANDLADTVYEQSRLFLFKNDIKYIKPPRYKLIG